MSLSLGMDPLAPAVLCGNSVATCTQDRHLWIWIWMGNFISTASLRKRNDGEVRGAQWKENGDEMEMGGRVPTLQASLHQRCQDRPIINLDWGSGMSARCPAGRVQLSVSAIYRWAFKDRNQGKNEDRNDDKDATIIANCSSRAKSDGGFQPTGQSTPSTSHAATLSLTSTGFCDAAAADVDNDLIQSDTH